MVLPSAHPSQLAALHAVRAGHALHVVAGAHMHRLPGHLLMWVREALLLL
jgi:hypothetical protein